MATVNTTLNLATLANRLKFHSVLCQNVSLQLLLPLQKQNPKCPVIAIYTACTWYNCAFVSNESSEMLNNWAHESISTKLKASLLWGDKARHLFSTQNCEKKLFKFVTFAKPFPNHATYSYAFNQKLCNKGNREFVLIGTRCWMDKLSFFFLPRYEINHMTKRKGCKQPTQARNRSFQGNASFTDNFAKQLLAIRIQPNCFFSGCVLTETFWMEELVCKMKSWLATPIFVWEVCNSKLGKHGRQGKQVWERAKVVLWEVHLSANGFPSAGVLHQDRTYPV